MIGWRPIGIVAAALMLHMKLSTCRAPGQGETGAPSQDTAVADVNLDGVDTSSLTAREKHEWSTYVSELLAPCADQPVSVAQCAKEKRACAACLPAARYLLGQVKLGRTRSQVEAAFRERFAADQVVQLEIGDSPTKGPSDAPVTLVEFADFECPACQGTRPMLDKVLARYAGRVRFVFKNYPLSVHENSELAARAGIAALRQGKFWEMHEKMFENGAPLDRPKLEELAHSIGLDPKKFDADLDSEAVADRVAKDRKLGDSVQLNHTPTIFVDGRQFQSYGDFEQDLGDFIDLEIELKGSAPRPSPSDPPSASAAAPVSSESPEIASAAAPAASAPRPAAAAASKRATPKSGAAAAPKPAASSSAKD